jgi:hypothetical protein
MKPLPMDDKIKDFELIEKAGLTNDIKLVAASAVSSLHYLKELSTRLGIPMEKITAEQIVSELAVADAQIREGRKRLHIPD